MLNGYKTYAVAALTVVFGVSGFLTGHLDANTAIGFILGGSGLGALRHGISTSATTQ